MLRSILPTFKYGLGTENDSSYKNSSCKKVIGGLVLENQDIALKLIWLINILYYTVQACGGIIYYYLVTVVLA